MENSRYEDYVTEKLFGGFVAGAVPSTLTSTDPSSLVTRADRRRQFIWASRESTDSGRRTSPSFPCTTLSTSAPQIASVRLCQTGATACDEWFLDMVQIAGGIGAVSQLSDGKRECL
jgi:hypothetical protein